MSEERAYELAMCALMILRWKWIGRQLVRVAFNRRNAVQKAA